MVDNDNATNISADFILSNLQSAPHKSIEQLNRSPEGVVIPFLHKLNKRYNTDKEFQGFMRKNVDLCWNICELALNVHHEYIALKYFFKGVPTKQRDPEEKLSLKLDLFQRLYKREPNRFLYSLLETCDEILCRRHDDDNKTHAQEIIDRIIRNHGDFTLTEQHTKPAALRVFVRGLKALTRRSCDYTKQHRDNPMEPSVIDNIANIYKAVLPSIHKTEIQLHETNDDNVKKNIMQRHFYKSCFNLGGVAQFFEDHDNAFNLYRQALYGIDAVKNRDKHYKDNQSNFMQMLLCDKLLRLGRDPNVYINHASRLIDESRARANDPSWDRNLLCAQRLQRTLNISRQDYNNYLDM